MPCKDHQAADNQQSTDTLTQDLCFMCGQLAYRGSLVQIASPRILKWWKAHTIADFERVVDRAVTLICEDPARYSGESETLERQLVNEALKVHPVSDYHSHVFFSQVACRAKENWRNIPPSS